MVDNRSQIKSHHIPIYRPGRRLLTHEFIEVKPQFNCESCCPDQDHPQAGTAEAKETHKHDDEVIQHVR